MQGRDRNADLFKLAQEFMLCIEWEGESYIGLDGKRPWGTSDGGRSGALEILGIEGDPEEGPSEAEYEYGGDLMVALPGFLRRCTISPPKSKESK